MQGDRPIVLTIAGFDPCGGAGVLADIKTFEQVQVQGMAIITAHTIQTENRFVCLEWQEIDRIQKGIRTLMDQYKIDVIKIGVVRDFEFLKAVVECVKSQNGNAFIIWDPVITSSSGFNFFKEEDLRDLSSIAETIDLITPNYDEYNLLEFYSEIKNLNALFVKGGHLKEDIGMDILQDGKTETVFPPTTDNVYPKHGSGCVLSSAIAAHLALGKTLEEACRLGKLYVEQFLNSHPALLGYHNNA